MARQWLARASAALIAGTVALAGVPMFVAVGEAATPASTVELGSTAAIRAGGAAITVPVTVKCSPIANPLPPPIGQPPVQPDRIVSIQVVEAFGYATTAGYGSASVVCDDTPHTVKVDVIVSAPWTPFKPGTAFARADFNECLPLFCGSITDTGEIKIVR